MPDKSRSLDELRRAASKAHADHEHDKATDPIYAAVARRIEGRAEERATAVADTPFQAAVCRDLQELRRLGTLRLADYQRAVTIVRKNEGNTYAEHSCMSVTEAADLAADLARLAGNVT